VPLALGEAQDAWTIDLPWGIEERGGASGQPIERPGPAGGRLASRGGSCIGGRNGYLQLLKMVSMRVTASSTACSLLHFSVTTREMALPQTFSV
jgi:hypothetical protein